MNATTLHGQGDMVWAILNPDQSNALNEIVECKSDQIAAILGAAMLDDSLRHALEYQLRPSTMTGQLFKPNRALGNTAPKIDLAYLLYAIDKPMMRAMQGISEIRNRFAHNLSMSFGDESINEAFSKLTLHVGVTHYPHPFRSEAHIEIEPCPTRLAQFIVNLKICLIHLMKDFQEHAPHSNWPVPIFSSAPPAASTSPETPA